jgi:hypothetical protein
MLREGVDTLAPATEDAVDSFHDDAGTLVVRAYPGTGESGFVTVLGPTVRMLADPAPDALDFEVESLAPFTGARFEIHVLHMPGGDAGAFVVTAADGTPFESASSAQEVIEEKCISCYFLDAEGGWLHVAPPADDPRFLVVAER